MEHYQTTKKKDTITNRFYFTGILFLTSLLTFADVSYTPQEECCFEINNTLKQQNDILAQFLNKKDTLLADKTGNNKNSITINLINSMKI